MCTIITFCGTAEENNCVCVCGCGETFCRNVSVADECSLVEHGERLSSICIHIALS
jgi:hypothetical protein